MRMPFLRRLLERLDAMMTAAAFAEEGEAETARQLLAEEGAGEQPVAARKRAEAPSRPARRSPGEGSRPQRAPPLLAGRPARRASHPLRVS